MARFRLHSWNRIAIEVELRENANPMASPRIRSRVNLRGRWSLLHSKLMYSFTPMTSRNRRWNLSTSDFSTHIPQAPALSATAVVTFPVRILRPYSQYKYDNILAIHLR